MTGTTFENYVVGRDIEQLKNRAIEIATEDGEITFKSLRAAWGVVYAPENDEIVLPLTLKLSAQTETETMKIIGDIIDDCEYVLDCNVRKAIISGLTKQEYKLIWEQIQSIENQIGDSRASQIMGEIADNVETSIAKDALLHYLTEWHGKDIVECATKAKEWGNYIRSLFVLKRIGEIVVTIHSKMFSQAYEDEKTIEELYNRAKEMIKKG